MNGHSQPVSYNNLAFFKATYVATNYICRYMHTYVPIGK